MQSGGADRCASRIQWCTGGGRADLDLDLEGRADGAAERVLAGDHALVAEDEALRAGGAEASAAAVLAPLAVGLRDAVALADGDADLVTGRVGLDYRVRVRARVRVRVRARARVGLGLGSGLGL